MRTRTYTHRRTQASELRLQQTLPVESVRMRIARPLSFVIARGRTVETSCLRHTVNFASTKRARPVFTERMRVRRFTVANATARIRLLFGRLSSTVVAVAVITLSRYSERLSRRDAALLVSPDFALQRARLFNVSLSTSGTLPVNFLLF